MSRYYLEWVLPLLPVVLVLVLACYLEVVEQTVGLGARYDLRVAAQGLAVGDLVGVGAGAGAGARVMAWAGARAGVRVRARVRGRASV